MRQPIGVLQNKGVMNNIQETMGLLLNAAIHNKEFTGYAMETDWREIYNISMKHQVQALLYPVVKDIAATGGNIDKEVLDDWKKSYAITVINQSVLLDKVSDVLNVFRNEGIPIIVLKGLVLRNLYPKPVLRTMGDIDVLVHEEQYDLAVNAIKRMGYSEYLHDSKHIGLSKHDSLPVEIHTKLSEDYFTAKAMEWEREIWQRASLSNINGIPLLTLSDSDHLLYLCLHMANHFVTSGFGIRQLCDLVLFIESKREQIDWEWFYSNARIMGIQTFIEKIFILCGIFFHLDDPIFSGYTHDEQYMQKMIDVIFTGGVFGDSSMASFITGRYLALLKPEIYDNKKPGSIKRLFKLIFPPYRIISRSYTYIQKRPYLTPIAWIHRIVANLFGKEKFFRIRDYPALIESHYIFEERYKLLKWTDLI